MMMASSRWLLNLTANKCDGAIWSWAWLRPCKPNRSFVAGSRRSLTETLTKLRSNLWHMHKDLRSTMNGNSSMASTMVELSTKERKKHVPS